MPSRNTVHDLRTIGLAASIDRAQAVRFPSCSAVLARMANVKDGLDACTLSDFVTLDSFTDFDNDTSTFVTGTLDSQFRHLGHTPVGEHEVDIAQAEARGIQFDEDIFRSCT